MPVPCRHTTQVSGHTEIFDSFGRILLTGYESMVESNGLDQTDLLMAVFHGWAVWGHFKQWTTGIGGDSMSVRFFANAPISLRFRLDMIPDGTSADGHHSLASYTCPICSSELFASLFSLAIVIPGIQSVTLSQLVSTKAP